MKSFFTRLNLYDIQSKFANLFKEITNAEEGTYEMSESQIKETLQSQFDGEVDELAQNVIAHLNNKNVEIQAYKDELVRVKDRINQRINVLQNEVSRFDPVLAHILKIKNEKSAHYPIGSITSRKSTSLDVGKKGSDRYETLAALLPEQYVSEEEITTVVRTINNAAIKKAVKDGDESLPETFHDLVVEKITYKTK